MELRSVRVGKGRVGRHVGGELALVSQVQPPGLRVLETGLHVGERDGEPGGRILVVDGLPNRNVADLTGKDRGAPVVRKDTVVLVDVEEDQRGRTGVEESHTGPQNVLAVPAHLVCDPEARSEVIEVIGNLLAFGKETMPFWSKAVCGRCLGDGSGPRCQRHLLEEALDGACGDLAAQRALVEYIARHVSAFARSFVWGKHHLRTEEGRAALISAAGWCSGWQTFIALMERMPEDG